MSVCPSNQEYLQRFSAAARSARVPLSGSLELTARCNLRCVHCYLGGAVRRRRASNELATAQWLDILDQVAAAGCLDLLLTGGEPLLRKDFELIYRHAKKLGMLVTVFTNGTRLSRRVVQLFRELPPRLVEVSLYGATAATVERITGSATAWARARRGVERLRAASVRLALKTILMRENAAELGALEAYARELGVPFRLDAAINPRLDGGRKPLTHRVDPVNAVELELADPVRRRQWAEFLDKNATLPEEQRLYICGAGITAFYVDADGTLRPCLMVARPAGDLHRAEFKQIWCDLIPRLHDKMAGNSFPCSRCEARLVCGSCPAFFELETGAETTPADYVCRLGRLRAERLHQYQTRRGD
ncbi:MAG TPA: radical SAM protein [Acidobacteriota bacterium]|nr:radical SAM protein [Acidobacteriota bacterium]HQF86433.1 radical SAM protein [Acidobacteriota bacterium]HQK88401.1 radical SAM protein [Acidobacteriota bacterium]